MLQAGLGNGFTGASARSRCRYRRGTFRRSQVRTKGKSRKLGEDRGIQLNLERGGNPVKFGKRGKRNPVISGEKENPVTSRKRENPVTSRKREKIQLHPGREKIQLHPGREGIQLHPGRQKIQLHPGREKIQLHPEKVELFNSRIRSIHRHRCLILRRAKVKKKTHPRIKLMNMT